MEYEICYLIGESKEADLDKIRPEIEGIIEKHKGTFLEGEFVRKRRMAYEIKGEKRGTYVARRFTIPSKDEREELFPEYDIMGEINKELRFNQSILRYMVVKTDDLPPLKNLDVVEEKGKAEVKTKEEKREEPKASVKEVKREEKKVEKEEIAPKAKKETPQVEEVKEEEAKVKEIVEEVKEEKPKKKRAKKDKEEGILGDDIDEKLDEILNI